MNLVEHKILEVYSVEDITNYYVYMWRSDLPKEPLYEVIIKIDCYGNISETIKRFFKSEWERNLSRGYYLA